MRKRQYYKNILFKYIVVIRPSSRQSQKLFCFSAWPLQHRDRHGNVGRNRTSYKTDLMTRVGRDEGRQSPIKKNSPIIKTIRFFCVLVLYALMPERSVTLICSLWQHLNYMNPSTYKNIFYFLGLKFLIFTFLICIDLLLLL